MIREGQLGTGSCAYDIPNWVDDLAILLAP